MRDDIDAPFGFFPLRHSVRINVHQLNRCQFTNKAVFNTSMT